MKLSQTAIDAVAGSTSGLVVSVVMSPLDVMKTRLQVSRQPKDRISRGVLMIMRELYLEDGIKSFYKGLGTTMLGYIPNWSIYFVFYQYSRSTLYNSIQYEMLKNTLSSITAGALCNLFTSPIWTVRTRMQTQVHHSDYKNTLDAFQKIICTEGIGALYRGLIPSMIGLVHVAIQFPLYERLKEEAKKRSNREKLSTSHIMFASSLSKAIASVTAYPHEVLRSRLQDHEHSRKIQQAGVPFEPYNNLREAIRSIWNQEGVRGFYRGLNTNLIRTVPAAVITLLTYEMAAKTLRNMFNIPERSS